MAVIRESERVAKIVESVLTELVTDDDHVSWDVALAEEAVATEDADSGDEGFEVVPVVLIWIGLRCHDDPDKTHTMKWYEDPGSDEATLRKEVADAWEQLDGFRLLESVATTGT